MKLTKRQLQRIITESINRVLNESEYAYEDELDEGFFGNMFGGNKQAQQQRGYRQNQQQTVQLPSGFSYDAPNGDYYIFRAADDATSQAFGVRPIYHPANRNLSQTAAENLLNRSTGYKFKSDGRSAGFKGYSQPDYAARNRSYGNSPYMGSHGDEQFYTHNARSSYDIN